MIVNSMLFCSVNLSKENSCPLEACFAAAHKCIDVMGGRPRGLVNRRTTDIFIR